MMRWTAFRLWIVVGTGRNREDPGEPLASIQRASRPLPQVTTSSLQALRAHAEGGYLWRRRQHC